VNRIRLITGTGLTCCLFLAGAGWAHGQREVRSQETRTTEVRRTSAVIGARVRLEDNASYGEVKDFVFNDNGCIDYVVIANEDDYVLVPWSVSTFDFEQRTVRIDITRAKIRQLTFTKDRWPNLSDSGYTRKIRTVFGDRAERREHRSGTGGERNLRDRDRNTREGDRNLRDRDRNTREGDRNPRDVERRNEGSTGREPARDNRDTPPRTNRDNPPRTNRDNPPRTNRDNPPRDNPPRTNRDNPPRTNRDTPQRPSDEKKRDRSDRPKP